MREIERECEEYSICVDRRFQNCQSNAFTINRLFNQIVSYHLSNGSATSTQRRTRYLLILIHIVRRLALTQKERYRTTADRRQVKHLLKRNAETPSGTTEICEICFFVFVFRIKSFVTHFWPLLCPFTFLRATDIAKPVTVVMKTWFPW